MWTQILSCIWYIFQIHIFYSSSNSSHAIVSIICDMFCVRPCVRILHITPGPPCQGLCDPSDPCHVTPQLRLTRDSSPSGDPWLEWGADTAISAGEKKIPKDFYKIYILHYYLAIIFLQFLLDTFVWKPWLFYYQLLYNAYCSIC